MSSVRKIEWLSPEDYLVEETNSEVRHQYVGGATGRMTNDTARHNRVVGNLFSIIKKTLEHSDCQTFISDMKVRAASAFYYPDVVVTCEPLAPEAVYLDKPKLIIEVLSKSTEGRDRLEKWTAYRTLEPLQEYVLVAQGRHEIDVYRRTSDGWKQISFGADETLELECIGLEIPMAEIYR